MENLFKDLSKTFDHNQIIPVYEFRIRELENKIIELADDYNNKILKDLTRRVIIRAIEDFSKEIIDLQSFMDKSKKIEKMDNIDDDYDKSV